MAVIKKKIVLLGDGAVGKTSLIRKFVTDKFSDDYIVTIGTKVSKKDLMVDKQELSLMIWDVLGQQGYTSTQTMSFQGATGALVVSDITRKETLGSLTDYWIPELEKVTGRLPMVFLANKADLSDKYQFNEGDLAGVAGQFGAVSMLTSALSGLNVENAFTALGKVLLGGKAPGAPPQTAPEIGTLAQKDIETLVDAADAIINDFAVKYGDRDGAMPIIRQQFTNAGVDIREPSLTGLKEAVKNLEKVERDLKGDEEARKNRIARWKFLKRFE